MEEFKDTTQTSKQRITKYPKYSQYTIKRYFNPLMSVVH